MIVDAGPLVAVLNRGEVHHAACRELLEQHPGPLLVPQLVIAEVAYLVSTRMPPQVEVSLLGDFAAGTFIPEPVAPADWLRMAELVWQYRDLSLGTTDASVVAAAERLGITTVATLDRRHFETVRPAHVERFEILP